MCECVCACQCEFVIKEIVHPKMIIMSFTHPHGYPDLYEFILLWNTDDVVLKKIFFSLTIKVSGV